MNATDFIIESCEHQNATTPADFVNMARAYEVIFTYAQEYGLIKESAFMGLLNGMIRNIDVVVYRKQPAQFFDEHGNMTEAVSAEQIWRLEEQLWAARDDLTPEEFYWELMRIHPWPDGNGRVGALMYNYLKGTLHNPVHPPRFDSKALVSHAQ